MTTTVFLIRHATHEHLGHILSGRQPGIGLSAQGVREARALAARLAGIRFASVHSSPVQRARETAQAIVGQRDVPLVVADALDEIDFGAWTGRTFGELDADPEWVRWNAARASARAAQGETMVEAMTRIVRHIEAVAARFAGSVVALVGHCDPIRAALAHYLGLSLDNILNFDIAPASVSRLAVGAWGGRVLSINEPLA